MIGHELVGTGPTRVIALHTWLADHSTFKPMFPYLDSGAFTYAFVDFRGYGSSRDIEGQHTIKEMAGDVVALADSLGWDGFHLLGNSMGGHAAQYVAGKHTERVKSVVLLNPVPVSGAPLEGDTLALFSGAAEKPENRGTIFNIATGERLSAAWRNAMVEMSVSTASKQAITDYLEAWTNTNLVSEVQGCTTPVKIILGGRDPIITGEVMGQTVRQWFANTDLETNPTVGHWPSLEAPCDTATSCEEFFQAHS